MKLLAAFGDERYAYMAAQALAEGCDAHTYGLELSAVAKAPALDPNNMPHIDCAVMPNIFAPKLQRPLASSERSVDELLAMLQPGTPLLMFGTTGAPQRIMDRHPLIDLSADEALTAANAEFTAEGAIYCAMRAADHAIMGSDCLIVGYGRIGSALTERLVSLGARVTVAARRDTARRKAVQRGAHAISIEEMAGILPDQQLVFSTPPELVLGEDALRLLPAGALVMDLASAPYGVDFAAAERLNIKAWLEPALPGRYCPKSAGHALLRAVQVALKEVL